MYINGYFGGRGSLLSDVVYVSFHYRYHNDDQNQRHNDEDLAHLSKQQKIVAHTCIIPQAVDHRIKIILRVWVKLLLAILTK